MEIYPGARANIERRAAQVIAEASPVQAAARPSGAFTPDLHIEHKISEADILGELETMVSDGTGKVVGFEIRLGGVAHRIEGDAYVPIGDLIDTIADTKGIREQVSREWVMEKVHHWVRDTRRGSTNEPLLDYILPKFKSDVRQYEFWMPIDRLHVQRGFRFGKGIIRPVTKGLIDDIQRALTERNPDRAAEAGGYVDRYYRRYQGFAAYVESRNVESSLGWRLAFEDASVAASVIRFFSGQAMTAQVRSALAPWGCAKADSINGFALFGDRVAIGTQQTVGVEWRALVWGDSEMAQAEQQGLGVISAILAKDEKSDYETALLESLLLYSRSLIRSDASDRLTYALIALERMFRKNDTEPITQSLADCLTMFAADELEDRRKLGRLVREAYAARSRFVHHGQSVADIKMVEEFLSHAWVAMLLLIGRSPWFATRADLLQAIDTAKLSGTTMSSRPAT